MKQFWVKTSRGRKRTADQEENADELASHLHLPSNPLLSITWISEPATKEQPGPTEQTPLNPLFLSIRAVPPCVSVPARWERVGVRADMG